MDINNPKNDLFSNKASTENSEIQNKIYSWFLENGLINKLQTHIRQQMITVLKENLTSNTNKINITSPKVQAINLLIAEFLLHQENFYTLSIFITEVPLLGKLYEFSSYVNHLGNSIQNKPIIKPKFQPIDVNNILETLGIQLNTDIANLTCQYYFNDKDNIIFSLLTCLFKAIITTNNDIRKCEVKNICKEINTYEHKLNDWLVSVEDTLNSININEEQKNTIKKLLIEYHQYNAQEVVYNEHFRNLIKQNKEMVKKVADLEKILTSQFQSNNNNILLQKEQLNLEQKHLYQLIDIFEEREKSTNEKFNKLEEDYNKTLKDINIHKYELELKEKKILKLEKMLKNKSINCIDENKTIEYNQIKLPQEQNIDLAKQLQDIKSKLDEFQDYKKIEQTNSKKIDNNIQQIETSLDKDIVRKLQKENDELREFINVQRQRIEELLNKTSNITKKIEKTQQISPITRGYQCRNVKKKINFTDDFSKRHGYYVNPNISSTTTTDYSTTLLESDNVTEDDDIIKEARSKLKLLEINTANMELNLKSDQINCKHCNNNRIIKNKNLHKIYSNLSEDLDFGNSKNNKINLKELANKIGYHRSIKRSMNQSKSGNDSSSEILQNTKFQDCTSENNHTLLNISLHNMNNINKESSINISCSRCKSPINKKDIELSMNTFNTSIQSQKEIYSTIKSIFPKTNSSDINNSENNIQTEMENDIKIRNSPIHSSNKSFSKKLEENHYINNNDLQLFNETQMIDSAQKPITEKQDSSIEENKTLESKKEQENDHTISFGSNKTDKSSDFWE